MYFCHHPTLEVWSPDFSTSGLASPTWTRVKCKGIELCNSLQWSEWVTNPVQVQICDACGTAGCASGGYVHVSALGDAVLWTMPRRETAEVPDLELFPASCIAQFGAIALPKSIWASFRAAAREVPEAETLTRSDGQSICDAWITGPMRPTRAEDLVDWLRARLLASDTLNVPDAIQSVERWLGWFQERVRVDIKGSILPILTAGAAIEKFYFDGPAAEDWPALVHYNGTLLPALGHDHMFVPGS